MRWRRCLIIITASEIAARTKIATRIGIRGEEELSSLFCETGTEGCWLARCAGAFFASVMPPAGLPCPVPPSPPVGAAPLSAEDEPPVVEDSVPEEFESVDSVDPVGADAPPLFAPDDFAGGCWW